MTDDTTPDAIAQWMLGELERRKDLFQLDAVNGIAKKFGLEFTTENRRGSRVIDPRVLKAFEELTGDTVVWEHWGRYWRKRKDGDKPGRSQK